MKCWNKSIVEMCHSAWAAPVLTFQKKICHFCNNAVTLKNTQSFSSFKLRLFNSQAKANFFQLNFTLFFKKRGKNIMIVISMTASRTDVSLDALRGSSVLSTVDLSLRYWQDKALAAFTTGRWIHHLMWQSHLLAYATGNHIPKTCLY